MVFGIEKQTWKIQDIIFHVYPFNIALATVHGMDYLLTWNCWHIDNAEMKPVVRKVCANHGYVCPEICTPQELMGVNNDG